MSFDPVPTRLVHLSLSGRDRVGLVASVAALLFDLGADLGDTHFSVVDGLGRLTLTCRLPATLDDVALAEAVKALPDLGPIALEIRPAAPASSMPLYRIVVRGGDRPGLIARVAEALAQHGADIQRLDAERLPAASGDEYVMRLSVLIPPDAVSVCLPTLDNIAGSLGLTCHWTGS